MESPLNTHRPRPSYPREYDDPNNLDASNELQGPPPRHELTSSRGDNPGLDLPNLGSKREQSFLSLASLSLANASSSGLLGIFSSALDSAPPSPVPTPTPEIRFQGEVVEEFDRWALSRHIVRNVVILFGVGYAFAG